MYKRIDERKYNEYRKINFVPNFATSSLSSILFQMGNTKVLCTVNIDDSQPKHLLNTQSGWLSAEYNMLPGSSTQRVTRSVVRGRIKGRTHEIQRLIGRALRTAVDLEKLGPKTIWIDCDVIQADGGTRTTAITGSYIALEWAVYKMLAQGIINENPLIHRIAALSTGIVDDNILVDLNYHEDSNADVDFNIVMTDNSEYIEIQGTAEGISFNSNQLNNILDLTKDAIQRLFGEQKEIIASYNINV